MLVLTLKLLKHWNTVLYTCIEKMLELNIKVFWNPLGTQLQNQSSSSLAVVL